MEAVSCKLHMPKVPAPTSNENKLDRVVEILEMMNRRDRARTLAGFFRGLVSLIPLIILLWSTWYFYAHGADLIKMISSEAAKQAAAATQKNSGDLMKQLQDYLPK